MAFLLLRSATAGALTLPDNRAWELVSPPVSGINVEGQAYGPFATRSSPDGRRFLYPNTTPIPGTEDSAIGSYVGRRGEEGWSTIPVGPKLPLEVVDGTQGGFPFFTALGVLATNGDVNGFVDISSNPLVPENGRVPANGEKFEGNFDLYARTLDDPAWTWFTKPLNLNATNENALQYFATSDEGSGLHIAYSSPEPQDPNYPTATNGTYLWSPGAEHPTLIGLDESGTPISVSASFEAPQVGEYFSSTAGAISSDGTRVVYQTFGDTELFMRIGNKTLNIAKQGMPVYQGASQDTTRIYFTDNNSLPGTSAPSGGLYAYDVPIDGNPAHGHLEFIDGFGPHAYAGGVMAIPKQGGRIYYVKVMEDNTPQLFEYSEITGTSRYVASLSPEDGSLVQSIPSWGGVDVRREARVSANGNVLVFSSRASGIGTVPYDNGGYRQIFRYDAESGKKPICISCDPTGEPSSAAAVLSYHGTPLGPGYYVAGSFMQRNVSDDGSRVFFQTADPLVAEDTNEAADVYEWVDGSAHLLSSGKGDASAIFLDASSNGDDVFFKSFDNLDPRHTDGTGAIYDARVDGTPYVPPAPPPSCEGEGCQGGVSVPTAESPGSSALKGTGNIKPARGCSALARRARALAQQARQLRRQSHPVAARRRAQAARRLATRAKRCRQSNGRVAG